jgi:rhodanese-related sulfurtransferase
MSDRPIPLDAAELDQLLKQDRAVLVDVRETHEYAQVRVKGSVSQPLSNLSGAKLDIPAGKQVVFTCLSGMRTMMKAGQLVTFARGPCYVLSGGLNGWARAGLPLEKAEQPASTGRFSWGRSKKD